MAYTFERASEEYAKIIAPYTGHNARVFLRKGAMSKWSLQPKYKINFFKQVEGWKECHQSIQQYAINQEYSEDSFTWSNLAIDLDDAQNGTKALDDARRVHDWFQQFKPRPGDFRVWFSGKKGFHIEISGASLAILPQQNLHQFMSFIAGHIVGETGSTTFDFQLYAKRKTLRCAGTKRIVDRKIDGDIQQVQTCKFELTESQLMSLDIDKIFDKSIQIAKSEKEYKDLFSDKDIIENGINPNLKDFMVSIRNSFQEAQKNVEKVERKIKINTKNSSAHPICINDILTYNFHSEGCRNKAMLTLIAFYKDTGKSKEEVISIVQKWSEDIPWNTQKAKERVAQVRPATELAFNENGYDFSCRKCQSINKGLQPSDKKIRCIGYSCPFVEDYTDQGAITSIYKHINDLEKTASNFRDTSYRTDLIIDRYESKTYDVPYRVQGKCTYVPHDPKTHLECCKFCTMPTESDNAHTNIESADSLVSVRKINPHDGTSLRFIDINKPQKAKEMKSIFGIPKECPAFHFANIEDAKLINILVSSPPEEVNAFTLDDFSEKEKSVRCHSAFTVIAEKDNEKKLPEEGDNVSVSIRAVLDETDQSCKFYIEDWKNNQSFLDEFSVNKDLHEQLKNAFSLKKGDTVKSKILEKSKAMQAKCSLYDADISTIFLDIIYHSPLTLNVNRREERGFIHGTMIGDAGQGKSAAMKGLSKIYDLGSILDGAHSKRTGLLYSIDNFNRSFTPRVIWGAFPRNDRQMIAIEEFNQLPKDVLRKMTQVRSSGVVQVSGQASGYTQARTRSVWIGNPLSKDGNLGDFPYNILDIKRSVGKNQDLRRFDMAIAMPKTTDFNDEDLYKSIEDFDKSNTLYTDLTCRNLVLWSWTRAKDQIHWTPEAEDTLRSLSRDISETLRCDMSIVNNRDMPMRLGRIAQAVAAMVYSSDDSGENLWILPEHVKYACEFFFEIMTSYGNMGLHNYAMVWRSMNELTPQQEKWLDNNLSIQSWFEEFTRQMMVLRVFTDKTLESLMNSDSESVRDIIIGLKKNNMINIANNAFSLEKSRKFTVWLTGKMNQIFNGGSVYKKDEIIENSFSVEKKETEEIPRKPPDIIDMMNVNKEVKEEKLKPDIVVEFDDDEWDEDIEF